MFRSMDKALDTKKYRAGKLFKKGWAHNTCFKILLLTKSSLKLYIPMQKELEKSNGFINPLVVLADLTRTVTNDVVWVVDQGDFTNYTGTSFIK